MAANPESPVGLMVMLLQRYVDWIRETTRAQRFPETGPDPNRQGPLTSMPQSRTPPSPRVAQRPASTATRTQAAQGTPAPQPAPLVPAQRQIPEPVGERHKRRIPQDVKIAVSARDLGRCRQCGSIENLHFDHIIPVSRGGANTVANIQLLCGPCNHAKAAKLPGALSRAPSRCRRPAGQRLHAGGSWTSGPDVRSRNSA
jgi:HNH endonuclease